MAARRCRRVTAGEPGEDHRDGRGEHEPIDVGSVLIGDAVGVALAQPVADLVDLGDDECRRPGNPDGVAPPVGGVERGNVLEIVVKDSTFQTDRFSRCHLVVRREPGAPPTARRGETLRHH
jgi:hypothetical protein